MEIDWDRVKKLTLWHYEDLIAKTITVLDFGFIQEHYDHTMEEAATFAERIKGGYLQNSRETAFIDERTENFITLGGLNILNYQDLLKHVDSRENCANFLENTGIRFEVLIQTLNFLFRWILPFQFPVKELVETKDNFSTSIMETLRSNKVRSNLDILENGHTKEKRNIFIKRTGLAEPFILGLTHRADISRLAYVQGKTVKHLCGGGYDTLEKIANADIQQMEVDMTSYYATIGKSFSDFRAVIPLGWMIGGAKILPKVVED